jgi:hypothetical protein
MGIGVMCLHGKTVLIRPPESVAAHRRVLERSLAVPVAPGKVPDDRGDGCGERRVEDQDGHDLTVAGSCQLVMIHEALPESDTATCPAGQLLPVGGGPTR